MLAAGYASAGYGETLPELAFEADSASAYESAGIVTVRVVLDSSSAQAVTVSYSFAGDSATPGNAPGAGADFEGAAGSLSLEPGATSASIAFALFNDHRVEPSERFRIRLSNPVHATLGSNPELSFTIFDDDTLPSAPTSPPNPTNEIAVAFSSPLSRVVENRGDSLKIEVTLSQDSTNEVTVPFRADGGSATGGGVDYTLQSTSLTFPPGSVTQSIVLDIVDDSDDEPDETVELTLESPTGDRAVLGAGSGHMVTIEDDDEVTARWREEGDAADEAAESVFLATCELSGSAAETVTVTIATGGTAEGSGTDYRRLEPAGLPEGRPGQAAQFFPLVFDPGETSQVVRIRVVDDDLQEPDETVQLEITEAQNAGVGSDRDTITLTIRDDDGENAERPAVSWSKRRGYLSESESPTPYLVLDTVSTQDVVCLFRVDGSATGGGVDFTIDPPPVVISSGTRSNAVAVDVVDDLLDEADETITLVLTNVVGATIGENDTYTHWILDDDRPREDIDLVRIDLPTREKGRILTVLGSKSSVILPAGLAVDRAGNYYITDQGPPGGAGQGSVLMLPAGREDVLRIKTGLDQPGDIELSPDQRSMIIAVPNGSVSEVFFGISVRVKNIDAFGGNTIVYVRPGGRENHRRVSADGWFHFTDIMDRAGIVDSVTVTVEHNGITRSFPPVPLGQPGNSGDLSFGHTIVELEFHP